MRGGWGVSGWQWLGLDWDKQCSRCYEIDDNTIDQDLSAFYSQ